MAAEEVDVVICGGGIIASSIAYHLTLRGVKPLVVERLEAGCAASGKAGGFLARGWGSGPTVQLHEASFDLHEELAKTLKLSSYRRIPTLSVKTRPGQRGSPKTPAAWLNGEEVSSASLMDTETAQVTPLELTKALMGAALAGGAQLRQGVVTGVETEGEGVARRVTAVLVDGVAVRCQRAVFAMGPWTVLVEDWLGCSVPLEGIKSASIVYNSPALTSAVRAEPFALFCGEDPRYGTHLEVYPRSDGSVYICGIGGSDYVRGQRLRPGGDTECQELVSPDPARVAAARSTFAGISALAGEGAPDVAQACMRPCAPDALPLLGPVPGVENAFLAAGHNCWGILWAPITGKAMAELLVDGCATCVNLEAFSPSRFAPHAPGGRGRKQGAASVGEQW